MGFLWRVEQGKEGITMSSPFWGSVICIIALHSDKLEVL